MDKTAMWIRAGLTGLLFLTSAYWLLEVAGQIPAVPTRDTEGQVLDTYQRAKDILLVVLPLLTTALGYWFGAAGRENAEAKARFAMAEANKTQQRLEGVLGQQCRRVAAQQGPRAVPRCLWPGPGLGPTPRRRR